MKRCVEVLCSNVKGGFEMFFKKQRDVFVLYSSTAHHSYRSYHSCDTFGTYFVVLLFIYYGVTRSLKNLIWYWYQKNKDRVQKLKVLWKNERLHSTINKYTETLTFIRLQACCSRIATLKIWNSSPLSLWIAIFYIISTSTTSSTPSGNANFFHQSLAGRGLMSSLHWRNFGLVTESPGMILKRGGV